MQLISSIEINYFRSLYQLRLNKLGDLNLFVGGNDSGKSNVLRALNLFFNGRISDVVNIDFLQDVTHSRQAEAREAKGRLTIWIRVTFNNVESWKSLPSQFSVKKVWNRYSEVPEVSFDIEHTNNLQRFLNKINFIYVPAVKGDDTYSKYLRILYETISANEDVDLSTPAASLSSSVNSAIQTMSDRIAAATGVSSNIDVPSDFRDLFERLSFSTMQDEFSVPLRNRGDGLQARHIPHIIEFISEQNRKYNIWAYEEPENSLEMTKSFEVAEQFAKDFSQKNQIFVTSHSPSFYGLTGAGVHKYYVQKSPHTDGSLVSSVTRFSDIQSADQNLGLAHIIADRSKALFNEIQSLKQSLNELRSLSSPVVITEGKHDKEIIENAIAVTGRDSTNYRVMCCEWMDGEGGGAVKLKQTLENIPAAEPNVRIGIFDRDGEGISAFSSLKKFKADASNIDLKVSASGRVFAVLLPEVEWDDPYFALAGKPTAIEQMFPRSVIGDDNIAYRFDVAGGTIKRKDVDKLIASQGVEVAQKLVKGKIDILDKNIASERIRNAPRELYSNISMLLDVIDICVSSQRTSQAPST